MWYSKALEGSQAPFYYLGFKLSIIGNITIIIHYQGVMRIILLILGVVLHGSYYQQTLGNDIIFWR